MFDCSSCLLVRVNPRRFQRTKRRPGVEGTSARLVAGRDNVGWSGVGLSTPREARTRTPTAFGPAADFDLTVVGGVYA